MTDGHPKRFAEITIRMLIVAAIVAAMLWGMTQLLDRDDDRPPVVVSNGSVVIEDLGASSSGGVNGQFQIAASSPAGRVVWRHLHPNGAPRRFSGTVADSTCGTTFYATNLARAVFTYDVSGTAREIRVQIGGRPWARALEFDVDQASSQTQPAPERLLIDEPSGRLISVQLVFAGSTPTRTCVFADTGTGKVTFHQAQ